MPTSRHRPSTLGAGLLAAGLVLSACGGAGTHSKASASRPTPSSSLVASGKALYLTEGCEDCHTLNGSPSTGPSWKGLYLSRVHLTSGATVTATAAYLTKHVVDTDAMTVRGYPGEVMAEAIQADGLGKNPARVRALVAFIESLK